ncbi:MAG: hypothetical protein HUU35_18690, partial [Armatimonadetes bacterium]|nr:hypothetical protein [Armatimonadota bacterium]
MRAGDLWQPEQSRRIRKRIVVTGQLELVTPAHLGNGDGDEQVDLPLLRETTFASKLGDERPILTGASLAGALRSYLRCREQGWRQAETATVVGQK